MSLARLLLPLAVTAFASLAACAAAPTSEDQAAAESDLVGRDLPATDGGATEASAATTYPGGYACDPLENVGCPEGQACALSHDKATGEEKVACKSTAGDFCGYIFGWDKSHIIMDGQFIGMSCLAPGFPMAACRPASAQHEAIRCPLPSQFCVPSANGTYGYCDRQL